MTTSNKIKIFSKTGITPEYKTSGASGLIFVINILIELQQIFH